MKILIDMALEHYDGFVAKCDIASREYSILKNGVVVRDQKSDEQMIAILCERADAVMLLYAAGLLLSVGGDYEKSYHRPILRRHISSGLCC